MPRNETRRYEKSEVVGNARSDLKAKAGNIKANLETLRYLEGEGMVKRQKVAIRDDMGYIIVGLGGVGCQKCQAVKDQLYRDCEEVDIKRHVRFFFIDTDNDALKIFDNNEQIFLTSGKGAAEALADPKSPSFMQWCNPELNQNIAAIMGAAAWNEDGANRYRQVGRIKLAVQENRDTIKTKITNAVSEMSEFGAASYRVIVIAGIAGGTGSGTITDVPYIIRNAVDTASGMKLESGQFVVEGYILIPPACGENVEDTDVKIGNRNAYAALKEIDYFMNLNAQHAADPSAKYEFCGIESTQNIFDNCTIVDGVNAGGGIINGHVNEVTSSVVAHSVVNSMISVAGNDEEVKKTDKQFFGSTSFLSNVAQTATSKVNGANYTQFPKEANYRFLATGYSEVVIPVDLLKVYLMRKIFDKVYDSYSQAFTITPDAANEFVEKAKLDKKGLEDLDRANAPFNRLPLNTEEEITRQLKLKGPYYMLELIREVVNNTIPNNVAHDIDKAMLISRDKKVQLNSRLNAYKNLLREQHSHDFMVYTVFIEELQKILEEEGQILTDSQRRKKVFEDSFAWSPIDLNEKGTDAANMAIKNYLDGLVDDTKINRLANNFKEMLANPKNRADWKWLHAGSEDNAMDAASVIRDFIETYISSAVTATIEDYLVKFYSKDSELDSSASSNQARLDALDAAARAIIAQCNTSASPLIKTSNQNDMNFAVQGNLQYMIVPSCAEGLKDALINQGLDKRNIYSSQVNDRIVCYTLYIGLPPYIFDWTIKAEKDYEDQPYSLGLHMEQNERSGLNHWVSFPNLVPEKRLIDAGQFKADSRENKEYIKAKELIKKAMSYGLVNGPHHDGVNNQPTRFSFKLFKRFVDTSDLLQTMDIGGGQTQLKEDELVEKVIEEVKTYITDQKSQFGRVFANISELAADLDQGATFNYNGRTTPFFETNGDIRNNSLASNPISFGANVALGPQAVSDFADDMAPRILRKQWHKYRCLELGVRVMKLVEKDLNDILRQDEFERRLAERKQNFVTLLSSGEFLTRDTEECKWFIKDEQNTAELLSYGDKIAAIQYFNLFAAFLEYANLDDASYDNIVRAYTEWYRVGGRIQTVNNNKNCYFNEIDAMLGNNDPSSLFPMARSDLMKERVQQSNWINTVSGEKVTYEDIRDFYNEMKTSLKVVTQPEAQQSVQPVPVSGTWTCSCGASASGNFCTNCGAKKSEGWTCSCGAVNEGNFCSNCGTKKPEEGWTCSCGTVNKGNFCNNCGTKKS